MSKWLASAVVLLIWSVDYSAAQRLKVRESVSAGEVSAAVEAAARAGSVGDFAREVAKAGVPAGMIIRRADLPPSSRSSTSEPERNKGTVPLQSALSAFVGRHGHYAVTDAPGGGIFVSPEQTPCHSALNRRLSNIQISGPVYAVGYKLLRALNPKLDDVPPGAVRSGLSSSDAPVRETLIERLVVLSYQQLSLHEALDDVVRQVRGLVWVMALDEPRDGSQPRCVLQWFSEDATGVTSYDFFQLRRGRLP